MCLHVQSCKLVHVSGVCIPYKWLCFCVLYQRKDEERQKEEVTEEIHDAGNGKGILFIWGGTISVRGAGPKCRMLPEGCSICSECSPVPPCHLWQEKTELLHRYHWIIFFKRVDRIESSKEPDLCHQCQAWVRLQLALCLLLLTILHLYHRPTSPLLQPETLLVCSLDANLSASCCTVYHCTFQGTVLWD